MSNDFIVNVSEEFNLEAMVNELIERYSAQGFTVRTLKLKNGCKITFSKNCGGINMVLGMGAGITATCTFTGKNQDMLNVRFSDGDWTGKIIGCIVGWFLCFIPIITSIIGITKQLSLPKQISDDIQMIASE